MLERVIEIEAPMETCFDVINDLESYPEFLPTTREVSVRNESERIVADFKVSVIKDIHYQLRFETNRPTRIAWSLVRGDLMKKNDGEWTFEALSPTKTRATYRIHVEFGWMVPKTIVNTLTEIQLPDLMKRFKDRVEEVYLEEKRA